MDTSTALFRSISAGSARSLDIAVRSLLDNETFRGSATSVVAEGALSHHWNGLFQFAAIRVGAKRAERLLERVSAWFDAEGAAAPHDSSAELSPRARLYRQLLGELRPLPPRHYAPDAPEWWTPAEERLAAAVVRLRQALVDKEVDALELTFTRGLTVDEAAMVLGADSSAFQALVAASLTKVEQLLTAGDRREHITSERLLLQVFALDPRRVKVPRRPNRKPVLDPSTVIAERYEIEGLLGVGAFADVYRARDRDVTGHVVALKILRRAALEPQAVRAALRELQLIASVFHPSVVQLKDHGWFDGHLWFVMPLYRGETLAQRLERGPLGRREAREIFEVLAEALAAMHRVGVRHQDIKPENVFLANIGAEGPTSRRVLPVLLDLGVAAKDVELILAGTPAYFAPEVAARFSGVPDPPQVGPKADVFSLALTLRDALDPTPRDYVAAGAVDAFVSFRAKFSPRPPFRRDLTDLVPWFERWLHHSPDVRPSAEGFREQLSALTRPEERRVRRASVLRWLAPSLLAVVTLFVSVVYVLSKEATVQRLEADAERDRATRASEQAKTMFASLEAEEALRRQLESEVERLETQYQNSRFTREQLAGRLASIEGEASLLAERHKAQMLKLNQELTSLGQEHRAVLESIAAVRERRDELARELDRTKGLLENERERVASLEAERGALEAKVQATRRILEDTRSKIGDLVSWADAPKLTPDAAAEPGSSPPRSPGSP